MADEWDRFPDAQPPAQSGNDPWAQFPDAQSAEPLAPEQQASPIAGAVKNAHGAMWEPLLSVGSSAIAAPVAGFAGIGQSLKNLVSPGMQAGDRVSQVREAMTYQPRTAAGQGMAGAIAYPFEKLARGANAVGNAIAMPDQPGTYISPSAGNYGLPAIRQNETGANPLRSAAGAVANTAIQAAPSLLLKGRGKPAEVPANVPRNPSMGRGAGAVPEQAVSEAPAVQRPSRLAGVPDETPSKEALKAASQAAYKRAEEAGAVISRESFDTAKNAITSMLEKDGLDPTLHPSTTAALKRLRETEGPVTLEKLETLRRIAKDAQGSNVPADKRLAGKIVETIDNYADTLATKDLIAGSPEAVGALKEARGLYSRARKSETIQEMIDRAETKAGAHYTQAGMEHALRQEFKTLALNQKRLRMFTKEEQAAIKQIAKGGAWENALRNIGKFDPSSGGMSLFMSTLLAGGGAVPTGGASLLIPVAGFAAKRGATRMTAKKVNQLDEMVRRGPQSRNALATPARNALAERP